MTYKQKNNSDILNHWPAIAWVLHDKAEHPIDKATLDAQVASQDYFALLATRLDQVTASAGDNTLLEHSIKELLYLHQAYKISKKTDLAS